MRHRSIKSRAGKVMLGAVLAGALSGAGANIARATLTLDLEAPGGNPNAPVTTVTGATAGTPVTLTVYAVVTDVNNSGTSVDGLGGLFASFDAAGAAGSGLSLTLASPFNYSVGSAASNGSSYSYTDTASTKHVGVGNYSGASTGGPTTPTYDSTTPNNWTFAAYLNNNGTTVSSIFTGGMPYTKGGVQGAYFDVGTLTLSTTGAANGSTSTVSGYGRTQQTGTTMVAALWTENNVVETPAAGTAISADDTVTVTVGPSGPPPEDLPGDTDQNGSVGFDDFSTLVAHYGQTTTGGYTTGDFNNSGTVDFADFSILVANYGRTTGSIVLAPEPSSLGILGVVSLFAVQRRSRKGINA